MISLSDMLKILDQIPVWKSLKELPGRVKELEARVAALEGSRAKPSGPATAECPSCGGALKFKSERKDPTFGVFGHMEHSLECETCGHKTTRRYVPGKGYEA